MTGVRRPSVGDPALADAGRLRGALDAFDGRAVLADRVERLVELRRHHAALGFRDLREDAFVTGEPPVVRALLGLGVLRELVGLLLESLRGVRVGRRLGGLGDELAGALEVGSCHARPYDRLGLKGR